MFNPKRTKGVLKDKLKKEIREICIHHGDEGTSGYLLSEEQFTKIHDIIDRAWQEEREGRVIKLEKLQDDAKKYPAKYNPDFPYKAEGYNEGFNQAMRDVLQLLTQKD